MKRYHNKDLRYLVPNISVPLLSLDRNSPALRDEILRNSTCWDASTGFSTSRCDNNGPRAESALDLLIEELPSITELTEKPGFPRCCEIAVYLKTRDLHLDITLTDVRHIKYTRRSHFLN